jgi:hypothetical protein
VEELISTFLGEHGKLCGWLFGMLLLPVLHLYQQNRIVRRIIGARRWDWLILEKPRNGIKAPRRSPRSRPPIDDDKTPPG